MSTSVSSQIAQMQTWTNEVTAASTSTTSGTDMDEQMFLQLMVQQLQYQDPLDPMSNTEFLTQQAQFTQLSELMDLSETIEGNAALTQGLSLVGKEVTVMDPNDVSKEITGIVESAVFYENGCSVIVDGVEYPAGYILSASVAGSSDSSGDTSTEES